LVLNTDNAQDVKVILSHLLNDVMWVNIWERSLLEMSKTMPCREKVGSKGILFSYEGWEKLGLGGRKTAIVKNLTPEFYTNFRKSLIYRLL